jgi:hypothetical protein
MISNMNRFRLVVLKVEADSLMLTQPGLEAAVERLAQNELGVPYIPLEVPFLTSALILLRTRDEGRKYVRRKSFLTSNRSMSTDPADQP